VVDVLKWKAEQAQIQGKFIIELKMKVVGVGRITHACNPSYSGGRDGEDRSLRPAWAKKFMRPISTNKSWVQWYTPVIPPVWDV
jgi:hypothetical protein